MKELCTLRFMSNSKLLICISSEIMGCYRKIWQHQRTNFYVPDFLNSLSWNPSPFFFLHATNVCWVHIAHCCVLTPIKGVILGMHDFWKELWSLKTYNNQCNILCVLYSGKSDMNLYRYGIIKQCQLFCYHSHPVLIDHPWTGVLPLQEVPPSNRLRWWHIKPMGYQCP